MSITITLPAAAADARRLLAAVAEPCLVAAAALVGAGPVAQVLVSGAVRLVRGIEVEVSGGDLHIAFR